jgi:hypothetical protein
MAKIITHKIMKRNRGKAFNLMPTTTDGFGV